MELTTNNDPPRNRAGELLRKKKWIIVAELVVMLSLCFFRLFPFSVQVVLLAFASLSLWLRGLTWSDVGLRKFKAWWKIALWALLAAALIAVLANVLIQPLVDRVTVRLPNNSRFANLRGNPLVLAGWLLAVWTIVAFGEEMIFRGYLINRVADLVGKTRTGWIIALLGSSLIFGLAHAYQGLAGVISTGEVGFFLGILYLINKRNLWVNIVCHGFFDSISLVAMYCSQPG